MPAAFSFLIPPGLDTTKLFKSSSDTREIITKTNSETFEDDLFSYDKTSSNCQAQAFTDNYFARQNHIYAHFRQTQASPAYFQPGYYPRSNTPQPINNQLDPIQVSHSQNIFSHYQQQQLYFNRQGSYYASWYGSTPSLRVSDTNSNRQSFYFN